MQATKYAGYSCLWECTFPVFSRCVLAALNNIWFDLEYFTCGQLHPATDLVGAPCVAEKEQAEADHAAHYQQHGAPHKEHGSLEGPRGAGAEVQHTSLTDELRGQCVADTVVEQAEVARLGCVHAVPYPVRLNKDHDGNDGKTNGEYGPHDANGSRISHIICVVDFSCLLGW